VFRLIHSCRPAAGTRIVLPPGTRTVGSPAIAVDPRPILRPPTGRFVTSSSFLLTLLEGRRQPGFNRSLRDKKAPAHPNVGNLAASKSIIDTITRDPEYAGEFDGFVGCQNASVVVLSRPIASLRVPHTVILSDGCVQHKSAFMHPLWIGECYSGYAICLTIPVSLW
jgi:hypothetical protein